MTREVYLIIYHSPLFPAHWALYVPSVNNPKVGKKIHVFGDVAKGFEHEFLRNYNPTGTQRRHSLVLLAEVEDQHVVDVPGDGSQSADKTATDGIEQMALSIPAPTKSLTSSIDEVGPHKYSWLIIKLIAFGLM
jgi:hypothetical protein